LRHEPIAGARALPESESDPAQYIHIRRKDYASADGRRIPVLRDVAFAVQEHRFTCIIGPSGCGKTTTLRILLGLDDEFDGEIGAGLRAARIGAVFQEPRLLPWRTVEANVRLALPEELRSKDVGPLLDAVGLGEFGDRYPAELSLGMARRAAIARAFAIEPDLLVMDEPFVSLDEATADRLRELLVALWRADPVTVLMVTHNLREAVFLADRIVVLSARPAHVVGEFDIRLPRAERSREAVERLVTDLAARFPQSAG
jgi:NitT/TauT family transport system ATP-binding protein